MPRYDPHPRNSMPAATATATAAAVAAGTKSRRSHRKSRNGCVECKRRHIRCDEGRPACTNCTIAERTCSFPLPPTPSHVSASSHASAAAPYPTATTAPYPVTNTATSLEVPGHHALPRAPHHSPARSSSSFGSRETDDYFPRPPAAAQASAYPGSASYQQSLPSFNESFADAAPAVRTGSSSGQSTVTTSTAPAPAPPTPAPAHLGSVFTPQHLVLMHHLEAGDVLGRDASAPTLDVAVRRVADCPYLIDQALSLTALHLAHRSAPDTPAAASFAHQAAELQARGLSYFAREAEYLSASSSTAAAAVVGPRFLYAGLLSLHALSDALAYLGPDVDAFLDRFVDGLAAHRGYLYALRFQTDALLRCPEAPAVLGVSTPVRGLSDPPRGGECKGLAGLVESDAVATGAPEAAACRDAASLLQWAFDLVAQTGPGQASWPHAVAMFLVLAPHDLADALRARRPVALVVLAHFAVLMHRARGHWVCADNGGYIVRAVARLLGPRYADAMRWPLEAVER